MALFTPPSSSPVRDIGQKATWPLVFALTLATVIVFIVTPVLAIDWYQRVPFPGVLVSPHLLVTDASGSDWGPSGQLDVLDRIVEVNGIPITDQFTYERALVGAYASVDLKARIVFERSPEYTRARPCGEALPTGVWRCETVRVLRKMTLGDFATLFGLPYGLGLIYLLISIWVFRQRGNQRTSQVLALFSVAIAAALAVFFDGLSTNRLQWIAMLSLGGASGAMFSLGLLFPQVARGVERRPLLRFVGYIPGLAMAAVAIAELFNEANPWAYVRWQSGLLVLLGASLITFFVTLLYRRFRSDSPIVRQQTRIILWGSAAAFLPFLIWVGLALINPATPFITWLYLPTTALFPLSLAIAMLRSHQLNVDRLLTAAASYVVAGVLILAAYFLSTYLLTLLTGTPQTLFTNPGLIVLFILLAVLLMDAPRQRIERTIEQTLFKGRFDTRAMLQIYTQRLTEAADLTSVLHSLRDQLTRYFGPEVVYIYLFDVRMNAFVAQPDASMPRLPSTSAQWLLDSTLPSWLRTEGGPRFLQVNRPLPEILKPDQSRIETVGALLYVPLTGHQQLNGWLALGPKQTGQLYSADDLNFLSAIATQTALALERAVVTDDLQRRVNELNALSRISQAVNFTLDLDDIMELIYTQTSRVIDTRNFYIALADHKRGTMRFAFYVEGNERLYPDDEWPIDTGLSGEIMRRGQPIVTDDYLSECERRGLNPGGRPGRAWMGVPLNAGNVPMGIMAVSDYRDEVTYGPEQLQIFGAIADQAASVLDKGRLYRETAERARQLAALNEVGSSLVSTLDLRTVLTTIVAKAMELLNAESGSLLLADENQRELIFEVTLGPAAPDLRGQRLPINKGIAGAAAQTRQPQIVNEAQQDTRWLRDMDKTTDYSTRALLAVPMIVKDKVTGVIELLNKRGSASFTEEDQNLLLAFAVNAAVAVENARLFTMTDQALASRLDELSTLQEIDRQLNASLDIRRVMELTLDWGLRVIEAKAGSIALINRDEGTLVLMATRHYTYVPQSMPLNKGLAGLVARTGQPVLVNDVSQDQRYIAACPDTRAQLSVPIKRENEVIGVINLENPHVDSFGILQLDSASRLADHAAIAITNAQLYAEVQRANDAKGRFVSEVAHELAQPVTAIKGFNDLMVKGMAGPVSDMQKQFLSTVQFNAERLNTLIKDLLDIGRIETGRLKMDVGPVAIKPIIEETIRSLQSQIDERQMSVDLNVPDELPNIRCDRARLIQILTNLVSNAYKYTPAGGNMTISISHLKEIQPRNAPRGNWTRADLQQLKPNPTGYLACAVKDTGFGIAPEDQAKLFTQFFRSQNPSVREQRGTGLGLSITKSLIELQGGAIWVESELEKGSTFSFSMPIVEDGEHEPTG